MIAMMLDPLALEFPDQFLPSGICAISLGGSSSKQKSQSQQQSGERWNQDFLNKLQQQGPNIAYTNDPGGGANVTHGNQFGVAIPRFQGLEDMDFSKLESGLYNRQMQNNDYAYNKARNQTNEELSQSGLLNSPVKYSQGGAIDQLQRNYLDESQKAATDASNQTIQLKQAELARKTGFDMDLVKLFQTIMGQYADTALRAGQYGEGSSSGKGGSSGFNFGLFNFGGNQSTSSSTKD